MLVISAKTPGLAAKEARKRGKGSYIYLSTQDTMERKIRMKGLYGFKKEELIGDFTYQEIERLCRKIG